jgi:peroxisomal membrane protein 4
MDLKEELLKIVKGIRNGMYYGAKVRFMHSLVMSILFMKGTLREKIRAILKMTIEHSLRLALFVGVYKTVMMILRKIEGRRSRLHAFIGGVLGAVAINLDGDSPVNQQITLYIISRSIVGGGKLMQKKNILPPFDLYKWVSIFSWSFVMLIYAWNKRNLQPSMTTSMDFLYVQSDKYNGWTDYVPVYMPLLFKRRIERFMVNKFTT